MNVDTIYMPVSSSKYIAELDVSAVDALLKMPQVNTTLHTFQVSLTPEYCDSHGILFEEQDGYK